jgi:plastocyanin
MRIRRSAMNDAQQKQHSGKVPFWLAIGLPGLSVLILAACAPAGSAGASGPYRGGQTPAAAPIQAPIQAPVATATEAASGMQAKVVMRNIAFLPQEITVKPGTTITWTNEDNFEHTVTSGTRGNPTGLFDEKVPAGGSFSFTFEKPGPFEYYCRIHNGMHGTVIVQEPAGQKTTPKQAEPSQPTSQRSNYDGY